MHGRVETHHRVLDTIVDRRSEVLPVATGFALAGGPVFGRLGYMLFCDPPSNKILQYSIPPWKIGPTEGKLSVYRESANGARALTLDHQGRLLICEEKTGRVVREEPDGSVTVLASHYRGKRFGAPADVVYAIDGSVYFCDYPRRGQAARAGRSGLARIYQIPRKGDLRVVPPSCERPLGLALGPRQLELYATDAARMNIRVFTIAPDGGLSSSQVFAELPSDRAGRNGRHQNR
jgi:gluconolactonase